MLTPPLTDSQYLTHLLNTHGIKPTASAGQNFLICSEPIEAIISTLTRTPSNITELGAGLGPLTQALLAHKFKVKAIEQDQQLASILLKLSSTKLKKSLELIVDDLKNTDWTWPTPYQLVGNIPYNLSGLILRRLTTLNPAPAQAILLVQQEVGERLTASPPNMNLLGLAVQAWGSTSALLNIPANCFLPAPKVNSQLILMIPHTDNAIPMKTREGIIKLAKGFFQNRRKQMLGTLVKTRQLERSQAEAILKNANIKPAQRPQELALKQWQQLFSVINKK